MGVRGARGGGVGGVRFASPQEQDAEARTIIGASQGVRASNAPLQDRAEQANAIGRRISNDFERNRGFRPSTWQRARDSFTRASSLYRAGDIEGGNRYMRNGEIQLFNFTEQ
jgi:hypothetical protein